MGQTSKFITIIRPEFMEFCGDACRAAALNHLFYRIAGKCKDQPKEKIQAGQILWYGSNELITEEMSNAWGVCKVRKEVNELIGMNLFGKTSNPDWGADRTKHFFFGTEQCAKFLELCEEHNICFVHLDLPDEVKHLIYSSNANDKSIKCICKQPEMVDANDKSIKCNSYIHQMETMNISNANDKSIEAITKNTTKINNIEYYEERERTAPESDTPTVSPPVVGDARAISPQSDTQSQQGDAHGNTTYRDTLPACIHNTLPGVDTRDTAEHTHGTTPPQRKEATLEQNTPTPPPAQALPPTSEQAALGQKGKGKKQTEVKPEFTPEGELLYQDWCSLFHVKIPRTKAIILAANDLYEPIAYWSEKLSISRAEVLKRIMNWQYKNNPNYYGEGRGVKLFDVQRDIEGWISAAERKLARDALKVVPVREDRSAQFNMGPIVLESHRKGGLRGKALAPAH